MFRTPPPRRFLSVLALGVGCLRPSLPPVLPGRLPIPESAAPLPKPLDERVLPSGLRVILDPDPLSRVVAVASAIDAGASTEPPGKQGIAHMVEHLTFRGRDDVLGAPSRIDRWHRLMRLPITTAVHGATSWDRMTFRSVAPAAVWRELLAIEAARLADPLAGIDETTFELERRIIEDQIALRRDSGAPTGWRDMLGDDAAPDEAAAGDAGGNDVSRAALRLEDARAFVRDRFRPEHMTLVVAGALGAAGLDAVIAALPRALVEAPAAGTPRPSAAAADPPHAAAPPSAGHGITTIPVVSLGGPTLLMTWHLPSFTAADGLAAQWIPQLLAGRLSAARLARKDPGILSVKVEARQTNRATLLVAEVRMADGADAARVAQVVTESVGTMLTAPETRALFERKRAELRVSQALGGSPVVARALDDAVWANALGRALSEPQRVAALTVATWVDVQPLVTQYLRPPPALVLRVPAPPAPAAATSAATGLAADPLADVATWDASGLRALASPVGFAGAVQSKLANGLTLVFLRRPGAAVATAWVGFRGGHSSGANPTLVRWATFYRPSLDMEAAQLGATVGRGVDDDTSWEMVTFKAEQAEAALGLLVRQARARATRWPGAADLQRDFNAGLAADAPLAEANRIFWSNLVPDHPYGRVQSLVDGRNMTPAAATEWLDRTLQPGNAALVVVGDFEAAKVLEWARSATASWQPVPGRENALVPAPPPPVLRTSARGPRTAVVRSANLHMVYIRLGCLLPVLTSRDRAVQAVLASLVEERLTNDLRHVSGELQGVGVADRSARAGGTDLTISTAVEPARLASALGIIHRDWQRWASGAFDQAETNLGKWHAVGRFAGHYETGNALARELFNQWNQDRPFDALDQLSAQMVDASPADLARFFATCRDNAALVIAGDPVVIDPALAAAWPDTEPAR